MKKSSVLILILALLSGVLLYSAFLAYAMENEPKPLHERVLDELRNQQGVVSKPLRELPANYPVFNPEAPIPPQCYTKTAGQFNPCYVCHQNPVKDRENLMGDGGLQLEYSFSDVGMTNHWENLFEDRTDRVAKISDAEIDQWGNSENYSKLAPRLLREEFKGWIPDLQNLHLGAAAFDEQGFAKDGSHWVAFNYKPLPSTFWPTNGSTDDVMIRLDKMFREDETGVYSAEIYKANLAVVEATVKGYQTISSLPVDEKAVGKDLDKDGKLGIATQITALDDYVGAATGQYLEPYMYPKGTEFLHTVRYVGVNANGEITVSARMKEVRYMKKWRAQAKQSYARNYQLEAYAKEAGRLPNYTIIGDWGLDNGYGWSISGFIENKQGELRTASYEENLFCMGCHASVGATIDKTFSFPRKVDGANGWGYINLRGMKDAPNVGETRGEIATYLSRVGGGGEFRSNPEMFERWFDKDGKVNLTAISQAQDVYELITPSIQRARLLNKAYKVIVEDQDFIYGRDATVTPPKNVYHYIDNKTAPTLPIDLFTQWDIRLMWGDGY